MKNVFFTCFLTAILFVHPALQQSAHAQTNAQAAATQKTTKKPAARPTPKTKTGTLVVITNFEKATVTVNGVAYPAYTPAGEKEGMKLAARTKHNVFVSYAGNSKKYEITLNPGEHRYLMVELTGYSGSASAGSYPADPAPAPPPSAEPVENDGTSEEEGRVTVYAKPQGMILVDGRSTGQQTPGTVTTENGSRNIQVQYEDGQTSEEKVVRVRPGSNIRLFFRQN